MCASIESSHEHHFDVTIYAKSRRPLRETSAWQAYSASRYAILFYALLLNSCRHAGCSCDRLAADPDQAAAGGQPRGGGDAQRNASQPVRFLRSDHCAYRCRRRVRLWLSSREFRAGADSRRPHRVAGRSGNSALHGPIQRREQRNALCRFEHLFAGGLILRANLLGDRSLGTRKPRRSRSNDGGNLRLLQLRHARDSWIRRLFYRAPTSRAASRRSRLSGDSYSSP